MKQEKKVRYYIGKKQYVPEESDMLCSVQHDSFGNETAQKLYRTEKGSFFLVSVNGNSKARVQIVDESQAFDFMDEHTACIDTDTYDKIFGEPDKG